LKEKDTDQNIEQRRSLLQLLDLQRHQHHRVKLKRKRIKRTTTVHLLAVVEASATTGQTVVEGQVVEDEDKYPVCTHIRAADNLIAGSPWIFLQEL